MAIRRARGFTSRWPISAGISARSAFVAASVVFVALAVAGAGLAAITTMMVVGTGQAMAAAAAITTELSDGKSSVLGIIALLAGIVAVLLLWAYVKRAR